MKKITSLSILFFSFVLLMSARGEDNAFDAEINTIKQECKELIKECRYEGSKVTYYNAKNEKQSKSVELFMFLKNEYQIAISAKKVSTPLTIKLYDAAADMKKRILIKEYKNVQGTNFKISSNDLNEIYRKKVPEVDRLKNVHLDYSISPSKSSSAKEAVVLVYGNKQ
jgi:hypothetical protein